MKLIPIRAVLILIAMLVATGLSMAAKPRTKVADSRPKVELEKIVPNAFADWQTDERVVPLLPSPDQQAMLNKVYNQTLARTYVNSKGQRIMLSVAYGGDQSDSMQVHRPEVCYAAQGFQILGELRGELSTPFGSLPVKRLLARQGGRVEPITYWITVGDRPAYPGIGQKLVQVSYGLTGKIPDGMLVRVSSIDGNKDTAYSLQEFFIRDLVSALEADQRRRIMGTLL